MDLMELSIRLRSLTVFRALLAEPVVEAVCSYLDCLENAWPQGAASSYAELVHRLYQTDSGDMGLHIQRIVEENENVYIRAVGRGETPPDYLARAVETELETLQAVASLTPQLLLLDVEGREFLPSFGMTWVDLAADYRRRSADIRRYGWGMYARNHMFYLENDGRIVPVQHPDPVRLSELVGYHRERELVLENTRALLAGRPAANVLLTGDAGTGKSSTIKAVCNELRGEGLRLIELRKDQLRLLPAILDELSGNPLTFLLFIDDLSFQRDDDSYSDLKAVLEGSVSARSKNVAVYATSNRRHIIKERFSQRDGDDVHRSDTIQEAISLSERFGLHVTFQRPGKDGYLEIVRTLAERQNVDCPNLSELAERFALARGGRSPRCARQFVDSLLAQK